MRVVIQRVKSASIIVEEKEVAKINNGYLLLVGFGHHDNPAIIEKIAEKIKKLRIFSDEAGKMNLSITEVGGEILSVSQFTLYGDITGGNRPSFTNSATAEEAGEFYRYFNECLRNLGLSVQTGIFQAEMLVSLENDGPVTIVLDSGEFKWEKS